MHPHKLLLAFAALLIGCTSALAQSPRFEYLKQYGPSGPSSNGSAIEQLPDGHILIAATASFPTATPGQYQTDILLIKTTLSGDTLWTKVIGNPGERELAQSMTLLPDGDIVVAGYITPLSGTPADAYLVCTDAAGSLIWDRRYGGAGEQFANSVKAVSDGLIVSGVNHGAGAGAGDAWLFKTTFSGDTLWSRTFGGAAYDDSWDMEPTADGGYLLTGGSYSYATGRFDDAWLVKTNASGDQQWIKHYGLADRVDWAWALTPVVKGGATTGYVFVGLKNSDETSPGNFYGDLHFVKVDTGGNVVWDRSVAGPAGSFRQEGLDVKQTADGGFAIAGFRFGNTGNAQLYILHTDEQGKVQWDTLYGSTGQAFRPRALAITRDGGCVITGRVATQAPSQHVFMARISGFATGISGRKELKGSFSAYPVPAKDLLHIRFAAAMPEHTRIVLSDALGRQVSAGAAPQWEPGRQQCHISVASLPAGNYVLTVSQGAQTGSCAIQIR